MQTTGERSILFVVAVTDEGRPGLELITSLDGPRAHRTESPREETTTSILTRALQICPELLPPPHQKPSSITSSRPFPSEDHVTLLRTLVRKVVVGFRPARDGGVRLERVPDVEGIKVYTNYGHGGAGWQSCWGCAEDVVDLVVKDLC
jgi:D-amino-acid oxidase